MVILALTVTYFRLGIRITFVQQRTQIIRGFTDFLDTHLTYMSFFYNRHAMFNDRRFLSDHNCESIIDVWRCITLIFQFFMTIVILDVHDEPFESWIDYLKSLLSFISLSLVLSHCLPNPVVPVELSLPLLR